MKCNLKFSSQQIIIVIVAFLLGVGGALLVTRDNSEPVLEEEKVAEESAEATDEAEETEKTEETAATGTTTATATTTKPSTTASKPPAEFVTGKCSTGLSARKDTKLNAIVLAWSPCASDDFQFYKLVKSSKNSSPSYPADSVAFSSSNKNVASFVDKTVAQRTTYYYRLCVVQRLNAVNCSNVASASF